MALSCEHRSWSQYSNCIFSFRPPINLVAQVAFEVCLPSNSLSIVLFVHSNPPFEHTVYLQAFCLIGPSLYFTLFSVMLVKLISYSLSDIFLTSAHLLSKFRSLPHFGFPPYVGWFFVRCLFSLIIFKRKPHFCSVTLRNLQSAMISPTSASCFVSSLE